MTTIPADQLHTFMRTVLQQAGVQPAHASDSADVLMYASRRGVDTHGVRNLKPVYFNQIESGRLNLRPTFTVEHETPISARANGDSGLGLAASCWAMRLAMDKARQAGMGMVAMHNSLHYGAAGYYPWLALQNDMIGISMTGRVYAQAREYGVMPTFGAAASFSTNPLAISFPTSEEPPWLLDMATSTVPFNRISMMRDNGLTVPLGWGVDVNGQPTTDPGTVRYLFPLGGSREQGSQKGYGLAMMVTILCNLLSGGWAELYGDDPAAYQGWNTQGDDHFFAAMRVDLFRPLDDFKRGMDAVIRAVRATPKAEGHDRIYVAGEIEHETEQQRLHHGIPITPTVLGDLHGLAEKYGVSLSVSETVNQ